MKSTVRRVSSDSNTRRRSVIDLQTPLPSPSLLSVPRLLSAPGGSCRRLMSLTELETTPQESQEPPSEDISPECVAPAVLLVPPPYPHPDPSPSLSPDSCEPQETKDNVSYSSKSDMDIQIMVVEETCLPQVGRQEWSDVRQDSPMGNDSGKPTETRSVAPGQRVRIRLCDTRLDSGIGDDKHSQESQPSSSGPYEPVDELS